MAISREELQSLQKKLKELRAAYKRGQKNRTPQSVEFLRALRSQTTDDSDFIVLTTLLESECSRFGLLDECESLGRQLAAKFPEEPMPWITLAGFFLHNKEDVAEARKVIETAVEKATERGRFVRHAYNTRARIARRLGDFSLLEDTLRKLSAYVPSSGSKDIDFEDDFLRGLPPGSISEDVLRRYESVVARSRKAR